MGPKAGRCVDMVVGSRENLSVCTFSVNQMPIP